MRVVASGKLFRDRLRALSIRPAGEEVHHHLLHVTEGLLGDVGHEQRTVVQPLDRLLGGDADESRRRDVADLRVDGPEHRGLVHDDPVRRQGDERAAGHRIVGNEHGDLARMRAHRVGDLLRGEHETAGRVEE